MWLIHHPVSPSNSTHQCAQVELICSGQYWIHKIYRQSSSIVDSPFSVTVLNWTPIFEFYVVRLGSENRYKQDMCLEEIGISSQKHDIYSRHSSQQNWGGCI